MNVEVHGPSPSYRFPLAASDPQPSELAVMSGGRFIAPLTVLLGARVLGKRSWKRSLELALIAAGALHLLGAAVMAQRAAAQSVQGE